MVFHGAVLSVGELIERAKADHSTRPAIRDDRAVLHTAASNAAHCARLLSQGGTLDDVWRFCVLQTLDDYTSTLRRGGISPASKVFEQEPAPTGSHEVDAALAALAEHLAHHDGWDTPAWVQDPSRTTVWYPDLIEQERQEATDTAPPAFRRRGVFITPRALWRA